ncbi:hypothetical protein [Rhodococcus aetherivorans]|uniref:Rv2732c family membrane protein n=1 Tax=Rhodococcus aetherivorans TaxID=191292 RepID=UPI00241DCC7C|nr:hypothetical protein [Rhodococcus aetherivorans]WFS15623.1 hypothetical protein P9K37_11505 [Rhodococcus aetherivorans]
MSDDLSAYRKEFARIERKVAGEFDAGRRHRVLAACIVAVVLGLLLPQSDTEWSWTVLGTWFGHDATTTVPMRIFVSLALVFGVVSSTAALCTHRWRLASASMLGSGLASLFGLLGYWSQNGMPVETPHAPGAGMVLSWLGMVALTSQWLPVVLSRSPTDRHPHPVTTPVL